MGIGATRGDRGKTGDGRRLGGATGDDGGVMSDVRDEQRATSDEMSDNIDY